MSGFKKGYMIQKTMIQTSPPELESLNGLVERVTYHNPENGYCVLWVKVRGLRETQAVVGYTSSISVGESIQAFMPTEVGQKKINRCRELSVDLLRKNNFSSI